MATDISSDWVVTGNDSEPEDEIVIGTDTELVAAAPAAALSPLSSTFSTETRLLADPDRLQREGFRLVESKKTGPTMHHAMPAITESPSPSSQPQPSSSSSLSAPSIFPTPSPWLASLNSVFAAISSFSVANQPNALTIYALCEIPEGKRFCTPGDNVLVRESLHEVVVFCPHPRHPDRARFRKVIAIPLPPPTSDSLACPLDSRFPPLLSSLQQQQQCSPAPASQASSSSSSSSSSSNPPSLSPYTFSYSTPTSPELTDTSPQHGPSRPTGVLHSLSAQPVLQTVRPPCPNCGCDSLQCIDCVSTTARPVLPSPDERAADEALIQLLSPTCELCRHALAAPAPVAHAPTFKPSPSPLTHLQYRGSSSSLAHGGGVADESVDRFLDSLLLRSGEHVESVCHTTLIRGAIATSGRLVISNYKLAFFAGDNSHSPIERVPIGSVHQVVKAGRQITPGEHQYRIEVICKDRAAILRFAFSTDAHRRREPFKVLQELTARSAASLTSCFAFQNREQLSGCGWHWYEPMSELRRLGLPNRDWRVSTINEDYSLCPSYPQYLVVPQFMSEDGLRAVAEFRVKRRIPILSWYNQRNRATITRASQPKVGLLSTRCNADENMLDAIRKCTPELKKLIIIDARPMINATVNRGSGGGYENTSPGAGYPNAVLQFQGIGNIHVVSDALARVWDLCRCTESGQVDQLGKWEWARRIERQWLQIVSSVLTSSSTIVQHVARGHSCFVHCSDGWDRTSLLTSLAMLCLDSHYRTLKGFAVLIEKEWLTAGHPFSMRYGNPTLGSIGSLPDSAVGDDAPPASPTMTSQRSPTFPLFLDCVWQIISQFPRHFQFNANLLRALGHHHVSCRFGTFLCDTDRERKLANLAQSTKSFWAYVESRQVNFVNQDWNPKLLENWHPLQPNYELGHLKFWWACYSSQPFGKWERRLIHSRNVEALHQSVAPIILSQ